MSEPAPTSGPQPQRTVWQKRVIDPIVSQLTQGITPEKIALTLAVGSAFALFPVLGTTTLLCLVVGIALRLNQPIIQIVNAVCTPVHLPIIYCMIRFGNFLFGIPDTHFGLRLMNHMFWESPHEFWHRFGLTALHAIVAWALCAPFWMILLYVLALPVLREIERRRLLASPAAPQQPPADHPVP